MLYYPSKFILQKEHSDKSEIGEALVTAVSELSRLDASQFSQVRQALLYFVQLIFHRRSDEERDELIELVKRHSRDESEVAIMAQTAAEVLIERGKVEGIEQGIEQGIVEGKRASILQLLRLRFQEVPETLTERIAAIESASRLDTLLEQAMTAENLDDIQV